MDRRKFLKVSSMAGATIVLPVEMFASFKAKSVEIGLIADIHKDVMHDADVRLKTFISEANQRKLDFIIQLGDFCRPYDHNLPFLNLWNSYRGEKHHVLGNHDMDGGFTRDQVRKYWGMPSNYYSFDKKGIHFIILDGNDSNPEPWQGYNRYIGEAQQAWLKEDLKRTDKPTLVFSHQTLELEDGGVANLKAIQHILEEANTEAGFQKVLCCISGHHHTDFMTQINHIYYVQINSASYRWVGDDFKYIRYSEEINRTHEWIKYTIPYKESLYTFLKIDKKRITIERRKTKFVGPGPSALGMPPTHPHDPITPKISGFKITI